MLQIRKLLKLSAQKKCERMRRLVRCLRSDQNAEGRVSSYRTAVSTSSPSFLLVFAFRTSIDLSGSIFVNCRGIVFKLFCISHLVCFLGSRSRRVHLQANFDFACSFFGSKLPWRFASKRCLTVSWLFFPRLPTRNISQGSMAVEEECKNSQSRPRNQSRFSLW